jgi:hypothetical protein
MKLTYAEYVEIQDIEKGLELHDKIVKNECNASDMKLYLGRCIFLKLPLKKRTLKNVNKILGIIDIIIRE